MENNFILVNDSPKTWPTKRQLAGYYLYSQVADVPQHTLDPQVYETLLEQLDDKSHAELHRLVYDEFPDFRKTFCEPGERV